MQSIVYLSLSMSCSWFKIRLCSRDARLCLPGHSSFNQSWIRPCQHRKFISGSPLWSSIMVTCDFQELSDSKLCTSSGNCISASGNSVVDSTESGRLITENFINHTLQNLAGTFPEISSRAMAGLSSGNNFVFHGGQSSNAASWHTFPGGEKARECFSSRGQCCGTSPAYSVNVCCSNMQSASKMALERCSSKSATPLMSGCPRVFCMGKSER